MRESENSVSLCKPMPTDNILIHDEGAVRVIAFARPEKKNALTVAMYEALARALREADADEKVRVILLCGAPGIFTAGNDIGDFMRRSGGSGTGESAGIRVLLQLVDQAKPLIAAVDGPAIGIGTTLLLHADYVVASTRARFQLPFVNLGLSPEAGSSVLLPLLVGLPRASEWLMFGESIDAQSARDAGLVNAVVSPEEVGSVSLSRAQALAAKPPGSVLLTKRLLREPLRAQVKAAIEREGEHFLERLQSPEAVEAFRAFLAKHPPAR
jgi:enoyl-CoA hydratase/carnithine racemase